MLKLRRVNGDLENRTSRGRAIQGYSASRLEGYVNYAYTTSPRCTGNMQNSSP